MTIVAYEAHHAARQGRMIPMLCTYYTCLPNHHDTQSFTPQSTTPEQVQQLTLRVWVLNLRVKCRVV